MSRWRLDRRDRVRPERRFHFCRLSHGVFSAMEKKKNLFRIDTGRTHGWQVRIIRDGERHTKLFSDKKYGGEEAAYEKALAHRNEKLEELADLPEEGPLQTEEVHRREGSRLHDDDLQPGRRREAALCLPSVAAQEHVVAHRFPRLLGEREGVVHLPCAEVP